MATTSGRVLVSDARLDAIGKLVLADLAPGERREFTATVSLPAAADDRYQGASGELSLKFVAVDASARVAGVPGAGSGASVWTGGRELNANAGFALAVGVLALAFAALLWLGSVLRRTKR
ncbi:MAG: hypothetical protein LBR21_10400 [Propionibacteriaceae bacterium]|jgi:hypothetical protein|nr:hypothetical protein [Propionibacteriaceae bacterium]